MSSDETFQPLSAPVEAIMERIRQQQEFRRAKPTQRTPQHIKCFDLSGDVAWLAQFELNAEREQVR